MNLDALKDLILRYVMLTYFVTEDNIGGLNHHLSEQELEQYPPFSKIPEEVVDEWIVNDLLVAYLTAVEYSRYRQLNNFEDYENIDYSEHNFFDQLSQDQKEGLVFLAFLFGDKLHELRYLKQMLISGDYPEAVIALECSQILVDNPTVQTIIGNLLS
jgi:hypothetical protein